MMLVEAIARYLDAQGVVTFDPDGITGNAFIASVPASPDAVVVLTPSGGFAPDAAYGGDQPTFQVRTRAGRDPREAYAMQLAIFGALHGLTSVTLPDGTELTGCLAIQSDPAYMGVDANGRHEYSQNYRTYIRRPTAHRA